MGSIRVAKVDFINGRFVYKNIDNFINIIPLTENTPHYPLSPYSLKDENGYILENYYQFYKVYSNVPKITWKPPASYKGDILTHPEENHLTNGEVNQNYWNWRQKGLECKYPVRYPVGLKKRTECLYLLKDGRKLNYIEGRKEVYLKEYTRLVKTQQMFWDLVFSFKNGQNILIHDVDGPHQESEDYYKQRYLLDNFIINGTIDGRDNQVLDILFNDSKHPFGHGYCLAMAIISEL